MEMATNDQKIEVTYWVYRLQRIQDVFLLPRITIGKFMSLDNMAQYGLLYAIILLRAKYRGQ